jgi:signal transduction histidine kinase
VGLRLRTRIVLPFLLISLVATSAAAVVAVSAISTTLRARVQARALSIAQVISRSEFALNAVILATVKQITGADVIAFSRDGSVLATTFPATRSETVLMVTHVDVAQTALESSGGEAIERELSCSGTPCQVTFQRLSTRPDTLVAVVVDLSEVTAVTTAVTRALAVAVVSIVIGVALVSVFFTRRVTAPIEQLVGFARTVSDAPETTARAITGADEVGRLGTAFNEMRDRLQQSREALVRSEKLGLAGLLAARVAHDIRNPLSAIKMQAQLLQSRVHGVDERTSLAAILHDITTVESVIRDLLDVARPEELRLAPADPNQVIRQLLDHLEPQLSHRQIHLVAQLSDSHTLLSLDTQRFGQALMNLIVNACDAMPGGGTLEVATRNGDDRFVVEVRDDGTGIDPAMADRVFDPFVSTKRDGVGLGLVNVKAVVESHGGTIRLQPRSPRGTIASIMLPLTANG